MPSHDFLLITSKSLQNEDEINNIMHQYFNGDNTNIHNHVRIQDDIIIYIMDTLKFIKCKWPNGETQDGIDYCGYSLIGSEQLNKVKTIIESWKNIFEQGDSKITLTGEYSWIGEEKNGEYEQLVINKNEIIEKLSTLINMCELGHKEGYYILHLGI